MFRLVLFLATLVCTIRQYQTSILPREVPNPEGGWSSEAVALEEQSRQENQVKPRFSYTAPDGTPIELRFNDENGFQPV